MKNALFFLLMVCGALAAADGRDAAEIRRGVDRLDKPAWPAILAVWGEQAYPAVTVKSDWDVHYASVATARFGKGRAVAMGYVVQGQPSRELKTLYANAVRWAASGARNPRIGLIGDSCPLPAKKLRNARELGGCDVIWVSADRIGSDADLRTLHEFVKGGGGLVVNVLGYLYAWDHPALPFVSEYQPNRLLAPMGMAYVDNNGYEMDANGPSELEAAYAPAQLKFLVEASQGQAKLDKPQAMQAHGIVYDSSRFAPAGSKFGRDLAKAIASVGEVRITPERPLTWKEPLKRLAVLVRANEARRLPARKIKADPSAEAFPGKVPAEAPRVTQNVTFQVDFPHWASTGLYVPAGEVATVTVPKEVADKGLIAQIGCHNSPIAINDSWSRHPMLVMSWPIKSERTEIASPYGGLLYFVVPEGVRLPRQTVEVKGAVRAPRYMRGETPLYEWQTQIRHYPGPTAEIGSSRITLTVPSEVARKIENPEELMHLWDRIMDLYVDLGMRPLPLKGERVVSDQQIAYGYMYAGYPIMTFLDAADFGTSVKFLSEKGSWGHWHEIGHNQQRPEWTFEGTGEVTNNLFTLYVMEKIAGQTVKDWLAKQMPTALKHIEAGAPFEKWKQDPFLALCMYAQVQQAFGWEAFYRAFQAYRDAPEDELPKTDDEKRDQWLVRLSRACGRNLGPFFQTWGVPTSEGARRAVADLPEWMPEGMPKRSG